LQPARRPENPTDRQVMAKHAAVYPKPAEVCVHCLYATITQCCIYTV